MDNHECEYSVYVAVDIWTTISLSIVGLFGTTDHGRELLA